MLNIPQKVSAALEAILFIHGLDGSSANIRHVIEASGLACTRKIITFDLEGHGLSPPSGRGFNRKLCGKC